MLQMSVATDSPVSSSSSDDFAALLDAELDSGSSDTSPDQDEDNNVEGARYYTLRFRFMIMFYSIFLGF